MHRIRTLNISLGIALMVALTAAVSVTAATGATNVEAAPAVVVAEPPAPARPQLRGHFVEIERTVGEWVTEQTIREAMGGSPAATVTCDPGVLGFPDTVVGPVGARQWTHHDSMRGTMVLACTVFEDGGGSAAVVTIWRWPGYRP